MSVWSRIWRLELRRAVRDRSLIGLLVIFALLTAYAAWNGAQWAEQRRQAQALVAADVTETRERSLIRMRKTEAKTPDANIGLAMPMSLLYGPALPVATLAPLSLGEADNYPHAAQLHAMRLAHTVFDTHAEVTIENPATLAAGHFDLAFVIVFLMPLFLLAAAYDVWTQERDAGTADFLLSQPRHPAAVLAVKLLARSGVLLLMLTAIVVVSLVGVTFAQKPDLSGLIQTTLVLLLHGSFWMLIALAVNLRTRTSAQAAIACGGIWLTLLIFIPAVLAAVQDFAAPLPSRSAYVNNLREVELHVRATKVAPSLQKTATQPQRLNDDILAYLDKIRADDQQFLTVTIPYHTQVAEHVRLGNALRMLSPSVIAQDALDRIAGTDADRALSFQSQTFEFLEHLRGFSANYHIKNERLDVDAHYRRMPEFQFNELRGGVSLRLDFAALLIFCLSLMAMIVLGFRRRWLYGAATGVAS